MDAKDWCIPRRSFLAGLAAGLVPASAFGQGPAQSPFYVLKAGDTDRLRADFNINRSRVRLLTILSPT